MGVGDGGYKMICKEKFKLDNYKVLIALDSFRTIDSNRKSRLNNLYKNCNVSKSKDYIIYEGEESIGKFYTDGFSVSEKNFNRLIEVLAEIKRIFNIEFDGKRNRMALSVYYDIGNIELEEQIHVLMKFVGNDNLIINNLEIFQPIGEKGAFVKFSSLTNKLQIRYTINVDTIEELKEMTLEIDDNLKNLVITKMIEDDSK